MSENIQLQIRSEAAELTADEAVVVHRNNLDGFRYTMPEMRIKNSALEGFMKDIREKICPLAEYSYSTQKNSIITRYHGEDARIYIQGNSKDVFAHVYTKNEVTNNQIWEIYLDNTPKDDSVEINMTAFSMNGPRLDETDRDIDPKDLAYISEMYYPYVDIKIMFEQFFTGSENILLLVGEPGIGKSKMSTLALKYAHQHPENIPYDKIEQNPSLENQFINVVYVKSIDVLVNDQFWRNIEARQIDFVIIDDLDYMLTKRDSESSSQEDANKNIFLNQFLSFTDGVEKNKTKFIITTNQKYDDIDSALLRKGRLFDIIELRHLTKVEARKIWIDNGLPAAQFKEVFNQQEVLAADLGSEISKRKNNRINSATDSYLLEEGISKVKIAGRNKKIAM
jgi:hypothetical protein